MLDQLAAKVEPEVVVSSVVVYKNAKNLITISFPNERLYRQFSAVEADFLEQFDQFMRDDGQNVLFLKLFPGQRLEVTKVERAPE